MAIDTRNKRFSILGFGQGHGMPTVLPNPDGTFDAGDRYQLVYLYAGITLAGGPVDAVGNGSENYSWRMRRARGQ